MKSFTELYRQLEQTTSLTRKVDALHQYFEQASEEDKLWLLAIFTGRRLRGVVPMARLREWACEMAGLQSWMFEECYAVTGDLAETIALVLPEPVADNNQGLSELIAVIRSMQPMSEEEKKQTLFSLWKGLPTFERFLFNKLLTGGLRVGVSQKLICRALALHVQEPEDVLAHRLMGNWTPQTTTFKQLIFDTDLASLNVRPFPFCLAHPLDEAPHGLGNAKEWCAEWKWDGIRGQVIRRNGVLSVWTRGEELVTDRFPEITEALDAFTEDVVLDGEIMAFADGMPLPFQRLQTRINRKTISKKLRKDTPIVFMAYDMLEYRGCDIRQESYAHRRQHLSEFLERHNSPAVLLSAQIEFENWEMLKQIRQSAATLGSEGLMLKHLDSVYESGRKKGAWYKWKTDPMTIDAVLIYAQAGHGRRASMYTDYTFALWQGQRLVPFAKAYSGLTDEEIRKVDDFVKKNTKDKFGPVRSVVPSLVFELGFEGVNRSNRHKSGVAVRFPRILRWRTDKQPSEANSLEDLISMIRE